jgi:cardiolipin synthase A/B
LLGTTLTSLWIAYLVVVAVWITMQRRQPAATLAWILGLAALPYLGFFLFYVFGPRRLRRSRLRRFRARAALADTVGRVRGASDHPPPDGALDLVRLGGGLGGMPLSHCTDVQLLIDGGQTFESILAAIRAAKHHIHLEYYIFADDAVGQQFVDALVNRAQAGVEVRLLVDAVGSSLSARSLRRLKNAGAVVAFFHRVVALRLRPLLNMRTHRKIVICDGVVGFTGGINITKDEDERINPKAYRDTHVRLEGMAVHWLQIVFLEDWHYATNDGPTSDAYFPAADARRIHPVQILASGPDNTEEAIKRMYFAAITGAEKRVLLSTPYFVPDEAMLLALTTAALRGVDVRVLVPEQTDSRLVTAAARSYFGEIIQAGVRVYEYLPRMLHAKTIVVDELFCAVGTANMDNRSFRLNFEVSAVMYGPVISNQLAEVFERDLTQAREVGAADLKRRSFFFRLLEAVARLMSPNL